jgi:hypothetical protein
MIELIGPLHNLLQHFTNNYLRLVTLDFWPHYTNPLLNCQLVMASRYRASGWTTQKTHPLPSNGCPLLLCIRCRGMFTESLPSNGSIRHNIFGQKHLIIIWRQIRGNRVEFFTAVSNDSELRDRNIAVGDTATILAWRKISNRNTAIYVLMRFRGPHWSWLRTELCTAMTYTLMGTSFHTTLQYSDLRAVAEKTNLWFKLHVK